MKKICTLCLCLLAATVAFGQIPYENSEVSKNLLDLLLHLFIILEALSVLVFTSSLLLGSRRGAVAAVVFSIAGVATAGFTCVVGWIYKEIGWFPFGICTAMMWTIMIVFSGKKKRKRNADVQVLEENKHSSTH